MLHFTEGIGISDTPNEHGQRGGSDVGIKVGDKAARKRAVRVALTGGSGCGIKIEEDEGRCH